VIVTHFVERKLRQIKLNGFILKGQARERDYFPQAMVGSGHGRKDQHKSQAGLPMAHRPLPWTQMTFGGHI
jgi:hypothetical protein